MEKLLLEMVYCQKVNNLEEIKKFISCTLMTVQQSDQDVRIWTEEALVFLKHYKFLVMYGDDKSRDTPREMTCNHSLKKDSHDDFVKTQTLSASPLGRASTLSGISPQDAVMVYHFS